MMSSPFRYRNIFLYASLQFCGNIEEYFIKRTEKLVVFYVMPRVNNKFNLVRFYNKGILVEEKKVKSSSNIIFYYFLWYFQYSSALLKYFAKKEKVIVVAFHPLVFFMMRIQKLFRKLEYVYWIGDYFPGVSFSLKMYEKVKKFYHDVIPYSCYLSDKINKKMNGKILSTPHRKTVAWGVKPRNILRKPINSKLQILFVGLIKPSQGIENILNFLKDHKEYSIKILGVCEKTYYAHLWKLINKNGINKQVYFPNKFVSEDELVKQSRECHVALALYDTSPLNATNFADPGKVKSYAELGLPIIMSNISDTTRFIKKFICGEVLDDLDELETAIIKIRENYVEYINGLQKFNKHFYYESHYKKSFKFMENYDK